ncbi:chromosome segregation protein SMC [Lignipirellula cremea]|uniref:Chromosome partition protein Smc n=1 Tax=Lignipirellula cremea TaxID=2528010 RepID=A0A518DP93_9BACT|nr:chromosome segregation protein SMC [Lignipirellula cremea]QDU93655.1 Chromosome partition protein Smc [Lignipirellula cremea]
MLKALELVGFKSFADKTRFDFPPGITVVVGPNGSGKSNVVDAMKWVLGETSVKSLRGKEMSDVIFKGGASRKPLHTAEATIIFDNEDRRLPLDAPEVHVTRRVYRSGEGEYLINREPCRLKDIRDLFRGTGVGADAYSIIEQGKVDRMLQASPKDRRAIFEEAAGISRFKAKKIEAQRRLERVDQNMLRLSDIVEEVESRLRNVRSQAGKAKRYKEYSERLQQLRTQVGLSDYRRLTDKLNELETQSEQYKAVALEAKEALEASDARTAEIEEDVNEVDEAVRTTEARFSRVREGISSHESNTEHLRPRLAELNEEQIRQGRETRRLLDRAGELQQRLAGIQTTLAAAENDYTQLSESAADHETALENISTRLAELREVNEGRRQEYLDAMRLSASLGNQVSSTRSRLAAVEAAVNRGRTQLEELAETLDQQTEQLAILEAEQTRLEKLTQSKREELDAARKDLVESRRDQTLLQDELNQLRNRHSGDVQRAEVLSELEKRFEGLTTGVKEVLARARQESEGPFRDVRGLVADLIQVNVENAPLVDLALGDRAQYIVLSGDRLLGLLRSDEYRVAGRVGFLRLEPSPQDKPSLADLEGKTGVMGRLDRLARTTPEYEPLVRRLLAGVWLVRDLEIALDLSGEHPGLRYITPSGYMVDNDGAVVVGPRQRSSGLISRRSELRALRVEIDDLAEQIADFESRHTLIADDIERQDKAVAVIAEDHRTASAELADVNARARTLREAVAQLTRRQTEIADDLQSAEVEEQQLTAALSAAEIQLAETDERSGLLETQIRDDEQAIEAGESERQTRVREITAAKVDLAKSEQRLETLRGETSRLEVEQEERVRNLDRLHEQAAQNKTRLREAERAILASSGQLAELYLLKDGLAITSAELAERRRETAAERAELLRSSQQNQKQLRSIEEKQHSAQLKCGEIRHERGNLAERLLEDYGIDLSTMPDEASEEELAERDQIEEEISALRRKINNVGAVNMEALHELDELESRFGVLSGQYHDLIAAKESLERIIQRINADSRRLFAETLEAIRVNFQALYRRSFGGGKADLVLEPGVDILESGIDIVATPPGKPEFSNSLLSGGEKALTAVSLLMAIFQFRPSPFCVLDEVDAPFDEANVGRFVDVLREFLGFTKFVIVTHSKKTMTAANTLYGVTMQESGVSKKVSVQFDDVSDDGHISQAAVERAEEDAA